MYILKRGSNTKTVATSAEVLAFIKELGDRCRIDINGRTLDVRTWRLGGLQRIEAQRVWPAKILKKHQIMFEHQIQNLRMGRDRLLRLFDKYDANAVLFRGKVYNYEEVFYNLKPTVIEVEIDGFFFKESNGYLNAKYFNHKGRIEKHK